MPVTRSANKKMRVDEKRTVVNVRRKRNLKTVLKKAQESRAAEVLREAISQIDKAVKNNLIHKNKAARLKSQLMREAGPVVTTNKAPQKAAAKKSVKKSTAKKTSKSKTKK